MSQEIKVVQVQGFDTYWWHCELCAHISEETWNTAEEAKQHADEHVAQCQG